MCKVDYYYTLKPKLNKHMAHCGVSACYQKWWDILTTLINNHNKSKR